MSPLKNATRPTCFQKVDFTNFSLKMISRKNEQSIFFSVKPTHMRFEQIFRDLVVLQKGVGRFVPQHSKDSGKFEGEKYEMMGFIIWEF